MELWCEQILFESSLSSNQSIEQTINESIKREHDLLDELVIEDEQSKNHFIGHDQVPSIDSSNLRMRSPVDMNENVIDYVIEDHVYSKPPTMLLNSLPTNSAATKFDSTSSKIIDKPLNSFDDFALYLNESNAFQNLDPNLYVNSMWI